MGNIMLETGVLHHDDAQGQTGIDVILMLKCY